MPIARLKRNFVNRIDKHQYEGYYIEGCQYIKQPVPLKEPTMIDTQTLPNDFALETGCCAPQVIPPLSSETAQQVADDLQLIAHPIRLQILALLSQCADQLCVCDIEESLPVKQPTVSHHLRLLREAGLIEGEKRGLYVHYVVNQDAVHALWQRVQSAMTGIL